MPLLLGFTGLFDEFSFSIIFMELLPAELAAASFKVYEAVTDIAIINN